MNAAIDYLLLGHISADLTPDGGRVLGGTVSYAARVAQLFGLRVGVVTSACADEPLLAELLTCARVCSHVAAQTTTFENRYIGQDRQQTLFGHAQVLTAAHIPQGWLDAPLVHFAPVADELAPDVFACFAKARTLLTPQGLLRQWGADGRVRFKRWLDETVLRRVDVVVLSRQDVAEMPQLAAEYAAYTRTCIVTDGAQGGVCYNGGDVQPYAAFPVQEVDPTGAGDVFATAVLASLPRFGGRMSAAVRFAARLAAISVTRRGTHALTADDVAAVFQALDEELEHD